MKKKILTATLICVTAIAAAGVPAWAADSHMPSEPLIAPAPVIAPAPQIAPEEVQATPYYMSYTGKVTAVEKREWSGDLMLTTESETEGPANPIITKETFIYNGAQIKVGDTITIFYESDRPMILIWPPQYNAAIAVVNPDKEQMVTADLFDGNLLSRGGDKVLKPKAETQILTPSGEVYEGSLGGSRLLVFYSVSMESYPEQIIPDKIIVFGQSVDDSYLANIENAEIVVEGKVIRAPGAFADENGVIMVPLRAVAEALGYEVTWEGETQTVYLNKFISLTIGKDSYIYARMAPITLGTAPVLKDGTTYVPLSYFTEVLNLNNAYFFENRIVIDNQEKMQ